MCMIVPSSLHRYFWDADADALDTDRHRRYIAERLLERGDLAGVRWLLRTFSPDILAHVAREGRSLSPRSRNFWTAFFSLSSDAHA